MNNDNNNDNENNSNIDPTTISFAERSALGVEKRQNLRALRALGPKDAKWNLVQELCHEIIATYLAENPDRPPSSVQLRQNLIKEIKDRWEERDPDRYKLMLACVPQDQAVLAWTKTEGWNEAVWEKMRNSTLFSKERRATMINALYHRGITKSDVAAKMYLTLSGDYSEKVEGEKDGVQDKFREINKVLHKKT